MTRSFPSMPPPEVPDAPRGGVTGRSVQDAFRVMLESLGNVSEVAYAVGFRYVSHFFQAFTKRYETTPSKVREGV